MAFDKMGKVVQTYMHWESGCSSDGSAEFGAIKLCAAEE